jgi:glyoxylase-like metal-dependent hydrolase (beta-lactamase superfamily II)
MDDWLTSLARVKTMIPEDVLVLPAHNDPFHGAHVRIDHLIRGHERSLIRLLRTLAEPKRAVDVFSALFARPIGEDLIGMATGESLAHLNCLLHRGQAVKQADENGVDWYRAA